MKRAKLREERCYLLKLPLAPIGQGRPRAARTQRGVTIYDPVASKRWKKDAKMLALIARGVRELPTGPVALTIVQIFKRPQKDRSPKMVWQPKKPDVDNVDKLVLDSLEGIVYSNDSQVIQLTSSKLLAPAGILGQVLVHVKLEPRITWPFGLASIWDGCCCWDDELDMLRRTV